VTATLTEAYGECAAITRREARNFHYGIRLLEPGKRAALSAVYALARRIDDVGDGPLPITQKRLELQGIRTDLNRLGDSSDPVLLAVADVARRLPLPIGAFQELIDGVLLDLAIDADGLRFETFDDLVGYCRCVAGSIGRLCLAVFASGEAPAPEGAWELADTLGIGLQQVNILRDVREDLTNGRVYLPLSDLASHAVQLRLDGAGDLVGGPEFDALVRDCAARARAWYDAGLPLVQLLDRRSAACTLAMAGIYSRLLDRISADPSLVRDRRLSLSGRAKAGVAARALLGRAS
jgi:phytoene synthase